MPTPLNNSLLKGFEILGLFSATTQEISAGLIVDRLKMNPATAHRFLATLEHAGAVSKSKRGYYVLGPTFMGLASTAEEVYALSHLLAPVVDGLCRMLNESVMACQFTRHGPVCIAVANANRVISVNISIGTLLPAIRSAQGRVWLSGMGKQQRQKRLATLALAEPDFDASSLEEIEKDLDRISAQGYATNLGLNEPDIAAVSVPVRGRAGVPLLTLSAFGTLGRFSPEFVIEAKDHLQAAAKELKCSL